MCTLHCQHLHEKLIPLLSYIFRSALFQGDTGTLQSVTHRFTVEAARLIGQRALEDVVNPCGLRLVLRLGLGGGDGGAVVLQAPVLLLLLLLFLQDVGHGVQQVVEEFVRVLLHVVVEQV